MTRRRASLPDPLPIASVVSAAVRRAHLAPHAAESAPGAPALLSPLAVEMVELLRDCRDELRAMREDVRHLRGIPPESEMPRQPIVTVEAERLRAIDRAYAKQRKATKRRRDRRRGGR